MEQPQNLLDAAFSRASKKANAIEREGTKEEYVKRKELARVKEATNYLQKRLNKEVNAMPSLKNLAPMHRKLLGIIIGEDDIKKSTAHIKKSRKIIIDLCKKYLRQVAKASSLDLMQKKRNEFYARISSVVKRLDKTALMVNKTHKAVKQLPAIRPELRTIMLAGYPNTGKTTLLKAITGSSPEIKAYPFTTKNVKIGFFRKGIEEIQVLDTPGLLDRPESKRNPIERQALEVLRGIQGIKLFLLDPTQSCGYTLEEQEKLFNELKKELTDLKLAVNKADLATEEEKSAAQRMNPDAVFSAEKNPKEAKKAVERLLAK